MKKYIVPAALLLALTGAGLLRLAVRLGFPVGLVRRGFLHSGGSRVIRPSLPGRPRTAWTAARM